eukprot:CAMPEP_0185524466 /NCGR_PEP_ID=MMETSP1366-20130426/88206_1 /TAXON_ID=38817 /ORGANISM="Gephyrocapsa oceanica, Strain RCC1303" /LENGTH=189 /DNA_ID=CAMNT_0028135815 /DNA_START=42 /DNA_END=608 /DNA_ORIENTATION=-
MEAACPSNIKCARGITTHTAPPSKVEGEPVRVASVQAAPLVEGRVVGSTVQARLVAARLRSDLQERADQLLTDAGAAQLLVDDDVLDVRSQRLLLAPAVGRPQHPSLCDQSAARDDLSPARRRRHQHSEQVRVGDAAHLSLEDVRLHLWGDGQLREEGEVAGGTVSRGEPTQRQRAQRTAGQRYLPREQ